MMTSDSVPSIPLRPTVTLTITRCADLPGGLPAIWTDEPRGEGRDVTLYLLDELPDELVEHFRAMAVREVEKAVWR